VVVAEVDAEQGAGRAIERHQYRRSANCRIAVVGCALDHEAGGLKVAYEARDGGGTEPGLA
jgi:hypothetical protein